MIWPFLCASVRFFSLVALVSALLVLWFWRFGLILLLFRFAA